MVHLCLDFEGVLIPEIWQCLAKEVNSDDLMLTTQDLKDNDELISLRMKVVNQKNIKDKPITINKYNKILISSLK